MVAGAGVVSASQPAPISIVSYIGAAGTAAHHDYPVGS